MAAYAASSVANSTVHTPGFVCAYAVAGRSLKRVASPRVGVASEQSETRSPCHPCAVRLGTYKLVYRNL